MRKRRSPRTTALGSPDGAPLVVALETSGPVGSVALGRGPEVLGVRYLEGRSAHAARLIPTLEALMESLGASRRDIGGVVVGGGPGSFTGVRVAAATAKGLAHALDVPLRAVSSLEAAAVAEWAPSVDEGPWKGADLEDGGADGPGGGHVRYVLFDARGDRVYAACYRLTGSGIEGIRAPRATRVGPVLAEPPEPGVSFVGSGAVRHRELLVSAGVRVLPAPAGVPTAGGLLHVLGLRPELAPLEDPWAWEPDYLRASGAERARR